MIKNIPYSILDLATVLEGKTAADSFHISLQLAKQAEAEGYTRYWFAEHHNMAGVASSAPAILIGYIAANTDKIRVGSGGIMLPNHAPLIVAEQFGTLASLYPSRIDLGLGRAPGTDQLTAMEIRGANFGAEHNFPKDIQKLQKFFFCRKQYHQSKSHPGRRPRYTYLDIRFQHRQCHGGRSHGIALCICQSFCACSIYSGY